MLLLLLLFVGYPFGDTASTRETVSFEFVAAIEHERTIADVALVGSTLALADQTRVVRLFDVSSPAHPEAIGTVTTDVPVSHLATDGSSRLITAGHGESASNSEMLSVCEIVDLSAGGDLVAYRIHELYAPPRDVVWKGDRALVALGEEGVAVLGFDGSGQLSATGRVDLSGPAEYVALDGRDAFVAEGGTGSSSVWIFDVADATSPSERGNFDSEVRVRHMTAVDGWLAMGTEGAGISFADVSDPAGVERPTSGGGTVTATSLDADDGYVYSTWGARGGLRVYDTVLGSGITGAVFVEDLANAGRVVVSGAIIAVVDRNDLVRIARRVTQVTPGSTPTSPSKGGGCS